MELSPRRLWADGRNVHEGTTPMHCGKPIRFKLILEGELDMTSATAQFTVTVAPGTTPPAGTITITPNSGALPGETEGQPTADQVAVVSTSGPIVLPLNYAFTGQPDGVSFEENDNGDGTFTIVTTGTPSAGDAIGGDGAGNYTINLTVTDSAPGAPATARRSLTVKK
jgi:hypothetical protein